MFPEVLLVVCCNSFVMYLASSLYFLCLRYLASSLDNPRDLYQFVEMPGENRSVDPLSSSHYSDERDSNLGVLGEESRGNCDLKYSLCSYTLMLRLDN